MFSKDDFLKAYIRLTPAKFEIDKRLAQKQYR